MERASDRAAAMGAGHDHRAGAVPGARTATRFFGYGYQTWLFPGPRRQFALLGIHGQSVFVDPAAKLVLVHMAVRVKPSNDPAALELRALWSALVARFGDKDEH